MCVKVSFMVYALFDYIDTRGRNDFKKWTESLQKPQRAKLKNRVDQLAREGSNLFPEMLTGTDVPGVLKLRISGNVQLRPMLCKGPIDTDTEFTFLLGAIEVQGKLQPKKAAQIANDRKKEILDEHKRKMKTGKTLERRTDHARAS